MVENEDKPKFVQRPVTFHKIYATSVSGEWTEYDFRIELFNEKLKGKEDEHWTYVSEAMIILAPSAIKKLKNILDKAVEKEIEGGRP